jgi:hypothetical protein
MSADHAEAHIDRLTRAGDCEDRSALPLAQPVIPLANSVQGVSGELDRLARLERPANLLRRQGRRVVHAYAHPAACQPSTHISWILVYPGPASFKDRSVLDDYSPVIRQESWYNLRRMRVWLLSALFVLGIVLIGFGTHRYAVASHVGTAAVKGLAYQVVEEFLVSSQGHMVKGRGSAILHYQISAPTTVEEQTPFSVTLTVRRPELSDEPNVIYFGSPPKHPFPSISPNRLAQIQFQLSPPNQTVTISPAGYTPITTSLTLDKSAGVVGTVSWSVTAAKPGRLLLILNSNVSSHIAEASDIVFDKPLSVPLVPVKATWEARWERLKPSLGYFLGSFLTLPGIIAFLDSKRRTRRPPAIQRVVLGG